MEDENKVEPEYLKGFNEGYTIAQYQPDLAEKLASIDSDFIRLVGFKDGRNQYQKEQERERLPLWLKGDPTSSSRSILTKSKDRDIEPDKD
ncbi:hypothetical protein EQG79_26555 [Spirosoma sordidisoli]|uniref:Uncharacterized protein n=2 Tax=Spirosoma sordidisoli TaxID=2502893 RepID=A0A4Q2UF33_9BACT|nr:hypothetical protein EQG79_26555 [Spirosoma sordidisoli]